jgi:D-arabinose 1-dehydrogenase-like Zn-dependent alcohol dehydrogenase
MKAMVLKGISSFRDNRASLELVDMPEPVPEDGAILIKVSVCGICHTELDEIGGRRDIREFLELAAEIPIRPEVQEFALKDANRALVELKESNIRGAKVLRVE